VASFVISPDSSRVLYQADQDNLGVFELYIVPIRGPAEGVKLNAPLIAGGRIYERRISPDSSRVVYVADQQIRGVYELYRVPLGGSRRQPGSS
jgi:Tol biopolymer transport system component